MNQNLQTILTTENIGLIVKAFQVLILIIFSLYAFLTIRQIGIMNKALTNPIHLELVVVAYFQFFVGLGLLLIVLLR